MNLSALKDLLKVGMQNATPDQEIRLVKLPSGRLNLLFRQEDEDEDILAICYPGRCMPIGRARNYIMRDGTVDMDYFKEKS